jgi:hypothetical protein
MTILGLTFTVASQAGVFMEEVTLKPTEDVIGK